MTIVIAFAISFIIEVFTTISCFHCCFLCAAINWKEVINRLSVAQFFCNGGNFILSDDGNMNYNCVDGKVANICKLYKWCAHCKRYRDNKIIVLFCFCCNNSMWQLEMGRKLHRKMQLYPKQHSGM